MLLVASLGAGAAEGAEGRVEVFTDEAGDARLHNNREAGAVAARAVCRAGLTCPTLGGFGLSGSGVAAPDSLDVVAAFIEETPDALVVVLQLASADEALAGAVDASEGVGVVYGVGWTTEEGRWGEATVWAVPGPDGPEFASTFTRVCHEEFVATCAWSVGFEFTPGSPAELAWTVPRALVPEAETGEPYVAFFGVSIRIEANLASAASWDVNMEGIVTHDGQVAADYSYLVDSGSAEMDWAFAAPAPATLDPWDGAPTEIATWRWPETRDDTRIEVVSLVETAHSVTVATRLTRVDEDPYDASAWLALQVQNRDPVYAGYRTVNGEIEPWAGFCVEFDCDDYHEVPVVFERVAGQPGWVNATFLRVDINSPAEGARVDRAMVEIWAAEPGPTGTPPGPGAPVRAGGGIAWSNSAPFPPYVFRHATTRPPERTVEYAGVFASDDGGDVATEGVAAFALDPAAASKYDVTSVAARAAEGGATRVTVGVKDLSTLTVPAGYDRVVYAAALDTPDGPVMAALVKSRTGEPQVLCAPDTLVFAATPGDPAEAAGSPVEWSTSAGRSRDAGNGTAGTLTFTLANEECFGVAPGAPVHVLAVGAATYLTRDVPTGAQLTRLDDAFGEDEATLEALAVAPPSAPAAFPWIPFLLVAAAVVGGGGLAAVAYRRRRTSLLGKYLEEADAAEPLDQTERSVVTSRIRGRLKQDLLAGRVSDAHYIIVERRLDELRVEAPRAPEPGVVFLGKYVVERELGRGAFGMTWLATHAALHRKAVIKQLHPSWSVDPEARARFRREAQILAAIDHPNVTRVYDVEEVGGSWYIVMEYVDGGSLEDRLARGVLPVDEAVRVAAQALAGFAHIHEKGIVHRDVKPSNLLLTAAGDVKLADFGVARAATAAATMLTQAGSPGPGTPLYMSPEQLDGGAGDHRSDLFALGVTFHHVVTGGFYLGAKPRDMASLARLAAEKDPLVPDEILGPALAAWLRKALAREPAARFQTASEMRAALLEAAVAGRRS